MWGSGAPRGWPSANLTIGTPVIGGTNNCVLYIDASGNVACSNNFQYNSGNLIVQPDDNNAVHQIGKAKIGAPGSDEAMFAHFDKFSTSNYLLKHDNGGNGFLNAQTGAGLYLKVNTVNKIAITAAESVIYNDTYWSGSGAGLLHGCATSGITSIAWSQVMAVNTWYVISDASIIDGDRLNGVTHDGSGGLTVSKAGVWDTTGIISIYSDTVDVDVQITLAVNGTARTTKGVQRHEIKTNFTDEVVMPTTDDIVCSATDKLQVAIRTITAGNPTLTVTSLTLKTKQIGG